jgi:hypothetical protein
MVTPDGWGVVPVLIQVSLARPGRQVLRVTRGPYFVADCRSVEEVAKHVDLTELVPEQRSSPRLRAHLSAPPGARTVG